MWIFDINTWAEQTNESFVNHPVDVIDLKLPPSPPRPKKIFYTLVLSLYIQYISCHTAEFWRVFLLGCFWCNIMWHDIMVTSLTSWQVSVQQIEYHGFTAPVSIYCADSSSKMAELLSFFQNNGCIVKRLNVNDTPLLKAAKTLLQSHMRILCECSNAVLEKPQTHLMTKWKYLENYHFKYKIELNNCIWGLV